MKTTPKSGWMRLWRCMNACLSIRSAWRLRRTIAGMCGVSQGVFGTLGAFALLIAMSVRRLGGLRSAPLFRKAPSGS